MKKDDDKLMKRFKSGDKAIVKNGPYARSAGSDGKEVIIVGLDGIYDYKVKYINDHYDRLYDYELEPLECEQKPLLTKVELVIATPTFNTKDITCGSLLRMKRPGVNLQGIVTGISHSQIELSYYDDISSAIEIEQIDVENVTSSFTSIELISKSIPVES
jgi:hypothetical protein